MKRIITSKWVLIPLGIILLVFFSANYKLAYKGTVENISFKSGDIIIEGVIVKPDSPGPHPGIVLLHGSGGSHQGHDKWYNRFHTNELLKQGFAVLSYTKRGSGNNDVDYSLVGFQDLINDAIAAVNHLQSKPYISNDKIGLMAVSESGWFAPEIAAKSGKIKFIINRVSPPIPVTETVLHELKLDALNDGFSEKEINDVLIPLRSRIWKFYVNAYDNSSIVIDEERAKINAVLRKLNKDERFANWFPKELKKYDPNWYAPRAFKYSYNPQTYIEQSNIPMLYILASDDVNVPTQKCVEVLEMYKSKYDKNITVKVFPDTGHYLYRWKMLPMEGFYVSGYLDLVGSWAAQQVNL